MSKILEVIEKQQSELEKRKADLDAKTESVIDNANKTTNDFLTAQQKEIEKKLTEWQEYYQHAAQELKYSAMRTQRFLYLWLAVGALAAACGAMMYVTYSQRQELDSLYSQVQSNKNAVYWTYQTFKKQIDAYYDKHNGNSK